MILGLTLVLGLGRALAGAASAQEATPLPVLELGEGVYGIQAQNGDMNTGFVVGDDGVLVFACNNTNFEQRLAAIRGVTDKPIKWAVNGHAAFDDSGCNSDWKNMGATVISSTKAREHYLEANPERYAAALATPAGQRAWRGRSLAPADVTFDDEMDLDLGPGREVRLMYMGKGHTIGDAVAYLPDQKVLFSADLLFVNLHPTVREGDSVNWERILERLEGLDINWIVTGHGDIVQGKSIMQKQAEYFETMRSRVRDLMQQGKSLDEIKAEIDLGEYATWGRAEQVPDTIEVLYRELGGTAA
jgi:glyoxylase-like metal-dependent hydrolase (beta-lactamase superfamily II)